MSDRLRSLYPTRCDNKAFIDHLIAKLDLALVIYPNAGISLAADFNRCPISSLLIHFFLKQIVKASTRNEATLDFILTDMSYFCSPASIIAPLFRNDHNSVLFSLQKINRQNQHDNKVTIRRGNASAKRAFREWLTKVNWLSLYQTVSCETKYN